VPRSDPAGWCAGKIPWRSTTSPSRSPMSSSRPTHRDYRDAHPSQPALLVEVSESTLAFDRRYKGSVYARAGVADYWIVNLVDEVLEVHRRPTPDPSAEFGWRYLDGEVFRTGGRVSPLARPDVTIAVADFLP